EENIKDAYRFLCENYEPGDRIFLFGFSRGAYQVRAVAGMAYKVVGLLTPGHISQLDFAMEHYIEPWRSGNKAREAHLERAQTFKRTFCRDVPIHFVGVWDTVSSVGLVRGEPFPYTTRCQHICYFRHALALDERRVKFLPEYVYGGAGYIRDQHNMYKMRRPQRGKQHNQTALEHASHGDSHDVPHVKEVWFAGCHSDVGGGNKINHDFQMTNPSLLWMKMQAESAGLEIKSTSIPNHRPLGQIHEQPTESLTGLWWRLCELLPVKRLSYASEAETVRWP
ncbi:hypothetical protein CONPUDRAFT_47217, partial [Coniophora puteana RWD-64-598 SS2]